MPFLEDVLIESPEDTFHAGTHLQECIGDTQPGGGESFSTQDAEAVVVYLIPFNMRRSFLRWVLGFSAVDRHDHTRIHRENPQHHPYYPWLYAATCSFSGLPPKVQDGVLWEDATFPADGGIKWYANYQKSYATVRFQMPQWPVRPDARITAPEQEVERNCYVDFAPSVETLSAEGELGNLYWRETVGGGPPNGPNVGDSIPAAFSTLVSKSKIALTWVGVPEQWLSVGTGVNFRPTNLLYCMGKTNQAEYLGYAPGTLLMEPPILKRFRWPVSTYDGLEFFCGYDVTLVMSYFDPPRGAPDPTPPAVPARGYKLMPYSRNLAWLEASRKDPSKYLLSEADFATAFWRATT